MTKIKQRLIQADEEFPEQVLLRLDKIQSTLDELLSKKKNERLSVEEVANELNVAKLTVYNWIKRGLLPADKLGRFYYIDRSQFLKALKQYKSLKYRR